MRRFRYIALTVGIASAIAVAYLAFALTASNTVPNTTVGDGTGTVTAYSATNIDYTLNQVTAYNIDAVTFTLTPAAAASVKVQLNGTWYSCTNSSGSVTCATTSPQATAVTATTLKVVAVT